MANYTPSNLAKAQARLGQAFAQSELRYRTPATFLEFVRQGQIMIPASQQIRTREDRTVEAYYKLRSSRALGSARAHNHTGAVGDSGVLTPSWTIYQDDFVTSLKRADNNVFSAQDILDNELQNVVANFAEGLESAAASYLYNNRSQVNGATAEGAFDGVTFVFEIASANENRAPQITKQVMDIIKYAGPYTFFCDTISFNKFEFYANQGTGNSENTSFQYGNIKFVHSPDLNASASGDGYTAGYWVAVPDGTIAALDWIPQQNRQGVETKENMYSTLINPVDGLTYAVHTYEERVDTSAANGETQDVKTEFEVSIDIALESAPLSTANETTIQAFGLI